MFLIKNINKNLPKSLSCWNLISNINIPKNPKTQKPCNIKMDIRKLLSQGALVGKEKKKLVEI
jgi:hypothetical protein